MSETAQIERKWPLAEAKRIASEIVPLLAPFCERIEIAGSIRRRRPQVGDIEILCIPKIEERPDGLFDLISCDLLNEECDKLLAGGTLAKRIGKNGSTSWGPKNKLGVYVPMGIPIDIFSTDQACWWNALVVRTGGKQNNLIITTTAMRRGERFEAYGSGFSRSRDDQHIYTTTSERDVFDHLGLPYLEPHQRR